MRILERKSDRGDLRPGDRDTPESTLKYNQKHLFTQAGNKDFPDFRPKKAQKQGNRLENRYSEGKLLPQLASETRILDQMVKSRLVKMQRTELLS